MRRRSWHREEGFTLIEIMVALAVVTLLMSSAVVGFGAVRRGKLRAGASAIGSAFRFAYVHALSTGRATRVVVSLRDRRYWIEDTEDAHVLDAHDPFRAGGAAENAEVLEAAARREAELMAQMRPRAPRAEFSRPEGRRYREREIEGAVFSRLYTAHADEPREEGNGYVYFFAGGLAERAVVQLTGEDGAVYSVMVEPQTGRAVVYDHAVAPPVVSDRDRERNDDEEVDTRQQEVVSE
ncbi:MAG: prepilin-type N-terminal cleavage/methylation domain-containing protein [Myxococcales bacterium]|nr:prepilin-type N-terminal cleavage/methylation domain-containing protein [Myxococcales bacterium]